MRAYYIMLVLLNMHVLKLTTNVNNEIANMFTGNMFR